MQTLWSRVAQQTRGTCQCPRCLNFANGIARRATASTNRRIPTYLTSSTFFYSGIFAAASVWDAVGKKQRREQWDRAISDLRREVDGQSVARGEAGIVIQEKGMVPGEVVITNAPDPVGLGDSKGQDEPNREKDLVFEDLLPWEQLQVLKDTRIGARRIPFKITKIHGALTSTKNEGHTAQQPTVDRLISTSLELSNGRNMALVPTESAMPASTVDSPGIQSAVEVQDSTVSADDAVEELHPQADIREPMLSLVNEIRSDNPPAVGAQVSGHVPVGLARSSLVFDPETESELEDMAMLPPPEGPLSYPARERYRTELRRPHINDPSYRPFGQPAEDEANASGRVSRADLTNNHADTIGTLSGIDENEDRTPSVDRLWDVKSQDPDMPTPPKAEPADSTWPKRSVPQIYDKSYRPFGLPAEDEIVDAGAIRESGIFSEDPDEAATSVGAGAHGLLPSGESNVSARDVAPPGIKQPQDVRVEQFMGAGPHQTLHSASIIQSSEDNLDDPNVFRDLDSKFPRPWPANTGPKLKRSHLPPQSIYSPWYRQETAHQRIWSQKKLSNVNMSVEAFLYRIFLELHQRDMVQEAAEAVPQTFAEVFMQAEDALRQRRTTHEQRLLALRPITNDMEIENYLRHDASLDDRLHDLCRYTQSPTRSNRTVQQSLERSLRWLFNARRQNEISTAALLSKVAYNLHASSSPPTVNTYNTLLLGFSVLKEHDLAASIIQSMDETKMRYNEVSFAAILDHYRITNQPASFIETIKWMRGIDNAPMLAHPNTWFIEDKRNLLKWKPEQPWKLLQLPYPTPYVFRAVLAGVTKFAGFDTALTMCQQMRKDGWGVSMAGFTILLKDCAERGDWESGNAVWKNILALKIISRRKRGTLVTVEKIGMEAFAAMLRLCLVAGWRTAYEEIWELARRTHPGPGLADRIIKKVERDTGIKVGGYASSDGREAVEQEEGLEMDVKSVLDPQRGDAQPAIANDGPRKVEDITSGPGRPVHKSVILEQEQLMGGLPGNEHLDEYELRERPMAG